MSKSVKRICIIGPSSGGKSTPAQKLGRQTGFLVLHLDKIAHIPGTNWQRCPLEETLQNMIGLFKTNVGLLKEIIENVCLSVLNAPIWLLFIILIVSDAHIVLLRDHLRKILTDRGCLTGQGIT